jgi:hypothetical protein
MSYTYRLKINNTNIPSDWVAPGSFNVTQQKRVVQTWVDANYVEHHHVAANGKAVITFGLRVRNLTDQQTFISILASQENITVDYWNDQTCTYKHGNFYMDDVTFNHLNSQKASLLYNDTQITLTEY